MAAQEPEAEDLEVTVEVVPQTVNDIVYMSEEVTSNSSAEDNIGEDQEVEFYRLSTTDPINLTQVPLVLDESQTFVILPQENEVSGLIQV